MSFVVVTTSALTAVADDGTLTIDYPAGTTATSFLASGHEIVVNDNDVYTTAASQFEVAFGADDITITNRSGHAWPAHARYKIQLDKPGGTVVGSATQFTSREQAINKEVERFAIDPLNLDYALQHRWAHFSLARYSDYSRDDISPALRAAVADVKAAGRGTIYIPPGTSTAKSAVTVDTSNIFLFSDGDVFLNLHEDIGVGQPFIDVPLIAATISTTLTQDVDFGALELEVASAAGIVAGAYIELRSSGEYWSGIASVSGFRVEYKSERLRVKSVFGTTLTLEAPTFDSYDATNYTVTLTVTPKYKHVGMAGLGFYGRGILSGGGPKVAEFNSVEQLTVRDVNMENFGNGSVQLKACDFFAVHGGWIRGYDLSDPDEETDNYSGYNVLGCSNGLLRGMRGTALRRLANFDAAESSVIPRHILVADCVGEANLNIVGSHFFQDLSVVNCFGKGSGIYLRGKDMSVLGCRLDTTGTGASTGSILMGNDVAFPCSEDPSLGVVNIQFNTIISTNNGIASRSSIEGGVISNNDIQAPGHGMLLGGKRLKNSRFDGNNIRRNGGDADGHYAVYLSSAEYNRRNELRDLSFSGNTYDGFNVGIWVDGCADYNAPAYNIVSNGDTMKYDYPLGVAAAVMYAGPGYFGDNIGVRNAFVTCPLTSGIRDNGGEASRYRTRFFDDSNNWFPGGTRFKTNTRTTGAAPASRTNFTIGDAYEIEPPVAGFPRRFVCTSPGTRVSSGFPSITGSMTAAGTTLTLSADPNVTSAGVITNNCSSTTGWTIGTGWTHASTKFTHAANAAVAVADLSLALTGLTDGQTYRVKVTITDFGTSSNCCGIYIENGQGEQIITANGDYYVVFTADGTTATLTFRPNRLFAGSIDNIEIDAVTWYVFPGEYLNIPGAGVAAAALTARIVSIDTPTTLTMDTAATTTVSGQTITQKAPTFLGIDLTGLAPAPASASASGVAGQIAADANYLYYCTAANTWKRVAIATW